MSDTITRTAAAGGPGGGDGSTAGWGFGPPPDPPGGVAASDPPAEPWGRYELLGEIARGGMGAVHRATDRVLGREVAVKVLQDRYPAGSHAARRFVDEARIAGQLQHPAIPAVHDLGTLPDGRPFLAMKLVKGRTLDDLLKERADPAADRGHLLAVFEGVCQAVAYAHSRGVIHRDLKPANVMVGAFGEVQVMDWGLAKVLGGPSRETPGGDPDETAGTVIYTQRDSDGDGTQAGSLLGTPAFMPPEQAGGEVDRIDRRADVFGLGAVLCTVLTGRPPYTGATTEAVRLKAVRGELADGLARLDGCGAEPGWVALAKRCLAFAPDDRPTDAGEVAAAAAALRADADDRARQAELDRVKAEGEVVAAGIRLAEGRRRRRAQLALALAVAAMAAGGGAFGWWQDRQAQAAEARTARAGERIDELLTRCEVALRDDDDTRAAEAALAEVDRLAEEGGLADADRLVRCRADLAVLQALDRIDDYRWMPDGGRLPDKNKLAARWREAFAAFGVEPGQTSPETAAARINGSLVRDRLLMGLDTWLQTAGEAGLREVVSKADPDTYRDEVRSAAESRDMARLLTLVEKPDALTQPPRFGVALGTVEKIAYPRRAQILEAAVVQRLNSFPLLMAIGRVYPENDVDGAMRRARWFQAAAALRPEQPTVLTLLGVEYHVLKDEPIAIDLFRRAIRIDPGHSWPQNSLGLSLLSTDRKAAMAHFREALRLDPKYEDAHDNLALALRSEHGPQAATDYCRQVVKQFPDYADGWFLLGRSLPRGPERIAYFRKAADLDPQSRYLSLLGKELDLQGQYTEAIQEYVKCIKESDNQYYDFRQNWRKIARIYETIGQYDNALAIYQNQIGPKSGYPHLGGRSLELAVLHHKRGDYAAAAEEYRKVLSSNRNEELDYRNDLGSVLTLDGKLDEAIATYRDVFKPTPGQITARLRVVDVLTEKGDLDAAERELRTAELVLPAGPTLAFLRSQLARRRVLLPRLADVAAGRAATATPAEALEFASLCGRPRRRLYAAATRLHLDAFQREPALAAEPMGSRYDAACGAALAAAGRAADLPTLGVEEWGFLTTQALRWLRDDLRALTAVAEGPDAKARLAVRGHLIHQKHDRDLQAVRDPAALQSMTPADRQLWEAYWSDADALLARIPLPPPKPVP